MINVHAIPLVILVCSFVWVIIQAVIAFFDLGTSERFIRVATIVYSLLTVVFNLWAFLDVSVGGHSYSIRFPDWFSISGYHLTSSFYIDFYGAFFALLSSFLFGIISKFSFSYLHKEKGFYRFFLLISILSLGIQFVSYAGSLDLIFVGWELVGVTSIHLIAFFQDNLRSVQNSFRTLVFYRVCDIFLLSACVLIHFYDHSTDFSTLQHHASENLSHWVGLFIILATLAKSAQFPMSNWLFRAMEGPTTSSAIYYGALSVHLGPFLLLRTESLWMNFPPLRVFIFGIGCLSAVYAALVGRTRGDFKSGLAYSTISQVGIIYMELALGLNRLAMVHVATHALLRTWQFLRSSSVIQDFLESPLTREQFEIVLSDPEKNPPRWKKKLYVHALNGFYLDYLQKVVFVDPFRRLSQLLQRGEAVIIWMTLLFVGLSFLPIFQSNPKTIVCAGLAFSLLFSLIGFSSRPLTSFTYIVISQVLLCYCGVTSGGVGKTAALLLISAVTLLGPPLIYLADRIQGVIENENELYHGLFKEYPKSCASMLIMGWLLVGIPGGPVQVAEDILFYKFLDISPWITILFGCCSFVNFLTFYKQFSKLFFGERNRYHLPLVPKVQRAEISASQYAMIGASIAIVFMLGFFPNLFVAPWTNEGGIPVMAESTHTSMQVQEQGDSEKVLKNPS